MKSWFGVLAFGAVLAVVQQDGAHAHTTHLGDEHQHSRPRRRLEPNANIAAIIEDEISKGVKHPRFTLTASVESPASQNGLRRNLNSETDGELFEVHVVLTDPSVTEATSISINGGESKPANSTTKFLVADHHADVSEESSSTFVILAVNEENGSVKGIVHKGDQLVMWVQESGETAVVSNASYDPPQDWTCNIDEIALDAETSRRLAKNKNREGSHDHDDDHSHSSHSSHSDNHFNLGNFAQQLGVEKMNLQSQRRRIYATDDWPNEYSYQVDMYIEVDTAMVAFHDPGDTTANMPNTVDYINALITGKCLIFFMDQDWINHFFDLIFMSTSIKAISTIYMREVDTKCKRYFSPIYLTYNLVL